MSGQPEDKEGVSNIMRRMKSALKKGSNQSSISEPISSESSRPAPPMNPTTTSSTAVKKPSKRSAAAPRVPAVITNWREVQQDRARALFAKYGLTLEPSEWYTPRTNSVQRIDRPVRMRVRRQCHRCSTSFGPDRVCVSCQHARCKNCPRAPDPKSRDRTDKGASENTVTARVSPAEAQRAYNRSLELAKPKEARLTLPSPTGGQDLVYRKPRQRVRRFCHKCQTKFPNHVKECTNCQHIRCTKCPRDPPNLKKYPNGYPGDVEPPFERQERVYRKPRRRVRYICHSCNKEYGSSHNACPQCGTEKCEQTKRDPPKKQPKEFDPEVVKSVQEKLAHLRANS